ncbi:hypothetical protein [Jiella marina]|uniref:hypothetical protein n=1 Tax=Jiella sp. LLJ827 TaxID=2917712 RepID=UPI0021017ED6|nr:hypothetical protein [Jiella sp. LLJ827]MCQ0990552.1 hypothetical protein [Jiella sp. LLJ827]
MNNPLFSPNGKPDINAVSQRFPNHGTGRITHQSSSGDQYVFDVYRESDGGYEVAIISQPGYRRRPSGYHETHRLPGPNGLKRICFKDSPSNLPTTVTLALWWAECTSRYIRDGADWQ